MVLLLFLDFDLLARAEFVILLYDVGMFFCHDHVVQGVLCKSSFDHILHVHCDHAERRAI